MHQKQRKPLERPKNRPRLELLGKPLERPKKRPVAHQKLSPPPCPTVPNRLAQAQAAAGAAPLLGRLAQPQAAAAGAAPLLGRLAQAQSVRLFCFLYVPETAWLQLAAAVQQLASTAAGLELPSKPLERPKKRPRLEHPKTCPRRDSREWRRDHQ